MPCRGAARTGAGLRQLFVFALLFVVLAAAVRAEDRHEGYYYPEVTSTEEYVSRAIQLPDSSRWRRIGFVTGMTRGLSELPYAPAYAIFAKGEQAEKLIIVAYREGTLDTVYRARALLASLTAQARLSPLFREFAVEDILTFLDLAKMLGFTQVTVSDGAAFAHQIVLR